MPVHPAAAGIEQEGPARPGSGRAVDGPAGRGWQPDQDDLGTLAAYPQHPVAVFLAASRPSMVIKAKSYGFGDSRAAVSGVSNCR